MLLRVGLVLALVAAAAAGPTLQRSREDIEAFRAFLKQTQTAAGSRVELQSTNNAEVNNEEFSGKYQGDILLDDFQIDSMVSEYAQGRNAYTWPNTHWPNNTVVWDLGEGHFGPLQTAAIERAIADIVRHTCVKFRRRGPQDNVFVRVTGDPTGCFANVGYWQTRGVHTLNLARNTPGLGCFRHTTIVHEWLHILGFLHMQSTHNRDNYVRINWANIQPGMEHNFDIYSENLVDNLGIGYDYVSCMHYPPYGFSMNGLPTITALQEHEGVMGQTEYITEKDWLRLNRHYRCPGAWD